MNAADFSAVISAMGVGSRLPVMLLFGLLLVVLFGLLLVVLF
jgi:hypothetical protein